MSDIKKPKKKEKAETKAAQESGAVDSFAIPKKSNAMSTVTAPKESKAMSAKNPKAKKISSVAVLRSSKRLSARKKRRERRIEKEHISVKRREYKERAKATEEVESQWWKLDNAALIYPSSTSKTWPAVFRISVYLKDEVKPFILQQAADDITSRFPFFNVRIKPGIFWYYFEEMPYPPVVKKESDYPCRSFELTAKKHLLRILYYNKKISIEFFHSLCDGKGAFKYFTTLLVRYFTLQGIEIAENDNYLNWLDLPRREEVEDAFARHADLKNIHPRTKSIGYQIKGTPLERGKQSVYTVLADIADFKTAGRKYGATFTEYLLAVIMQACQNQRKVFKVFNRPIGVQLPIDVRRFFETETLRNFSSYKFIFLPQDFDGTFEDIILIIRKEIAEISAGYVMGNINANVKPQKSKLIRLMPLPLKNIALRISSRRYGERQVTTTISNVGAIETPPEFKNLIDFYECLLGISRYNKFSVTCCSYNGKLSIAFTSKILEPDIITEIIRRFAADGVKVNLITNV